MADKGLMFVVGVDIKNFQAKMNLISKDLNKMSNQAQRALGPAMDVIGSAVKKIGIAGAAGFGAVTFAGIKMNAELEQSKIAFTTMLGSAEKADAFLQQMRDFAAKTPFEFNELQGAAKKMLAFGFTAEQVKPMLTAVGDAVSGLGGNQEMIDRITLAIGQMASKGKVSGEEMRQLAEAGIPAWQMLADKFGMTTGEVMKLSEKGLIPAGKAIAALTEGMEKKFGGMMEKQSRSMLGLWSTLKDTAKIFITDVIEPTFEKARVKFSEFMGKLEEWRSSGQLQDWAKKAQAAFESFWNVASTVVNGLITGGKFIADHWNAIGPILAGILAGFMYYKTALALVEAITIAQKALNLAMAGNPIGLLVIAAAGLAAAGYTLWERTNATTQAMQRQREEAEKLAQQQYAENRQIVNLADQYKGLQEQLGRTKKGTAEYKDISERLNTTKDDLVRLMPDIVTAYDAEGRAIDISTDKLNANANAARSAMRARLAQNYAAAWAVQEEAQRMTDVYMAKAQANNLAWGDVYTRRMHELGTALTTANNNLDKARTAMVTFGDAAETAGTKARSAAQNAAAGTGDALDFLSDKAKETRKKWEIAMDGLSLSSEKLRLEFDLFKSKMGEVSTEAQKMSAQLTFEQNELDLVRQRVQVLTGAWEQSTKKKGENAEETRKLYNDLLKELNVQADLEKQIKATTEASRLSALGISSITDVIKDQTLAVSTHVAKIAEWLNKVAGFGKQSGSMAEKLSGGEREQVIDAARVISLTGQIGSTGKSFDQLSNTDIANWAGWANGGIIQRPVAMFDLATGTPAGIAGEAGMEAIVPMGGGGNASTPTIIYNQNAPVYSTLDFEQKVKQTVRDGLQGGAFRGLIATP